MSIVRRPNLIIAGVNKAATTSLFMYLSAHPEICPAKIKEVQYFLPLRYDAEALPPIEQYLSYFDHCANSRYLMEATGGYFYGGAVVAKAIKEQLDNPRIVIMLRDPIERLFSFYKFKKSSLELDEDLTFETYIELCQSLSPDERKKRENNTYWGIEGGFYADYIDAWSDTFGESVLRILFFEHFKRDTRVVLNELCEWLGLEYEEFLRSLTLTVENRSVNYKSKTLQKIVLAINWYGESFWRSHPGLKRRLRHVYYAFNGTSHEETIADETRRYLKALFSPYNRRLAAHLIGRGYSNFPAWLTEEWVAEERDSEIVINRQV